MTFQKRAVDDGCVPLPHLHGAGFPQGIRFCVFKAGVRSADEADEGEHGDARMLDLRLPEPLEREDLREAEGVETDVADLR